MIDIDTISGAEASVLAYIGMEIDKGAWIRLARHKLLSDVVSLPRYNSRLYIYDGWLYIRTASNQGNEDRIFMGDVANPVFNPIELIPKIVKILAPHDWPN